MAKKRKVENKSASTPSKEQRLEAHQQQDQEQEQEQSKLNGEAATTAEEITEDAIEAEDTGVEEIEEDENLWQPKTTENAGTAANDSNSGADGAETTSAAAEGGGVNDEDEDCDGDDNDEPVQKLIEPLSKEQIIDLLREAAENHPDVNERIRNLADTELVHRKIFVHGLGWDTNEEVLMNTFKKYGEIEDCNAVCDKLTGKSKGYGFILFKHRKGARNALKEPQKKIGNRMTACQLASTGPVPAPAASAAQPAAAAPASEYTQRKIYVSNVSADIDPQKLLSFFTKFGEIEEGPLGLDKQTGKPKGFALFVFKSTECAKKALEEPHKNFEGHILHCQKAVDGPKPNKPYYQQQYQQQQQQQQHGAGRGSHFARTDNSNIMGSIGNHSSAVTGSAGHLMAPSHPGVSYNQGASQALNPVLGQAITALLATQGGGGGLGLTNLLGALGSSAAAVNQPLVNNAVPGGYGNQAVGSGYGGQPGYSNPQVGQSGSGRSQQHLGGLNHYMGH